MKTESRPYMDSSPPQSAQHQDVGHDLYVLHIILEFHILLLRHSFNFCHLEAHASRRKGAHWRSQNDAEWGEKALSDNLLMATRHCWILSSTQATEKTAEMGRLMPWSEIFIP